MGKWIEGKMRKIDELGALVDAAMGANVLRTAP